MPVSAEAEQRHLLGKNLLLAEMSCGRLPRSAAGRVCYNAARDVFFRIFLKTGVEGQKPDAWDRGPGGAVQPSKKPVLGTGAASQGGGVCF